jgi:hypothetical protein
MTRLWMRNFTSRKDSRTGPCVDMSRWFGAAGGAPGPDDDGTCGAGVGLDPPAGALAPGRALSIRFRRDMDYSPFGSVAVVNGR